jgi:BirA family transcriptional regulator, biotin operon repressor / biotin---[acetyl-CoA-carboxylase] ligase
MHGQTGIISGRRLGEKLGVSRTAIWKHVRQLRDMGIPIEAVGSDGYRVVGVADFSLVGFRPPAQLRPRIEVHHAVQVASTQQLAKEAAARGITGGHLWVAERQAEGRGRLGRQWVSGFGGLWMSLLLRPVLSPARIPPLTLIVGLALSEAVEDVSGVFAGLKWPNDLVVTRNRARRKLGGVLTEVSGEIDQAKWVVIGVGVNVNNSIAREPALKAISLIDLLGRPIHRALLLSRFLERFLPAYASYQRDGFAPFRNSYWQRYANRGSTITIRTAEGLIRGIASGVDDAGGLLVESRRRKLTIFEGEIVL